MEMTIRNGFAALTLPLLFGCATMSGEALEADDAYDLVIRGGTIYDGSGGAPYIGDVAVEGDRIVAVGIFSGAADRVVDASGKAVAPGFINMLSWANRSLLEDGRGMSDLKQGITLEVFGEGWTMGSAPMTAVDLATCAG